MTDTKILNAINDTPIRDLPETFRELVHQSEIELALTYGLTELGLPRTV